MIWMATKKIEGAKIGRKGLYAQWLEPENLTLVRGWARNGLTDIQIAQNIGINVATIYDWKNRFPEFANALKESKEVADRAVENALYKSAFGFVGPDGKYYPPNTTAQIFWLKNRAPKEWRDQRGIEMSGNVDVSGALAKARERMSKAAVVEQEISESDRDDDCPTGEDS